MVNDRESHDQTPRQGKISETPAPTYANVVSDAWVVEGMMQIQKSLGELTANVSQMKAALTSHQDTMRSDFRWTWSGLAGATVLLTGALTFGYFRLEDRQGRLEDQQTVIGTGLTRLEVRQTEMGTALTRLDDRQTAIGTTLTRWEIRQTEMGPDLTRIATKLDDLLQRTPPGPISPPSPQNHP